MFNPGTRVEYVGTKTKSMIGKAGVVTVGPNEPNSIVLFDGQRGARVVDNINLKVEVPIMTNFKSLVSTLLSQLDVVGLNPKDEAARRLGVAYELASAGEKAKKAAKKSLKGLGLLADAYPTGSEVIYDSEKFQITADTKEPASVIKVEALQAELQRRGLSGAVIAQIIAASYGANKPATTLVVVQK